MTALETEFGLILAPFWLPKSDQIGPKRAPKSIKKVIEKLVEFWDRFLNDFWSFFCPNGNNFSRRSNLKNLKIRALGSKCDPSLQDGLPGTENTQKSCKNEGRDYLFSGKRYFLPTAIVVIFSIIMIIIIIIIKKILSLK